MLQPGAKVVGFSLPQLNGPIGTLADLTAHGPVLLAFFKVACPVCQYTFPFLERLSTGSIPLVGISQDDTAGTAAFQREYGLTFPLLLDTGREGYPVSNMFRITHVPTLFLVSPGGKVEWASTGFSRSDLEEMARRAGVTVFREGERTPDYKPG